MQKNPIQRELIASLLQLPPPQAAVRQGVMAFQAIAVVYLKRKVGSGRLNMDFLRMPLEDLAMDSIAELFQQDDHGTLVQIKAYFDGFDLDGATDLTLLPFLRRLVISKVNNTLFRYYNTLDPILGRILRNIKLSLSTIQTFRLSEILGEMVLIPEMCDTLQHLPRADSPLLESNLRSIATGQESVPQMLALLSRSLRDQEEYSRIVPLMTVAWMFRAIYMHDKEDQQVTEIEDHLTEGDALTIIRESCDAVKREAGVRLIRKKGLHPSVLDCYYIVIEEYLRQTIVEQDGDEFSYFDRLKGVIPDLTREAYSKEHKSRIEYLGRLTHDRVVENLKQAF